MRWIGGPADDALDCLSLCGDLDGRDGPDGLASHSFDEVREGVGNLKLAREAGDWFLELGAEFASLNRRVAGGID
jgi:hypothetical protein